MVVVYRDSLPFFSSSFYSARYSICECIRELFDGATELYSLTDIWYYLDRKVVLPGKENQ